MIDTRGQCYKICFVCNLLIFLISQSVSRGKPLKPTLMLVGKGQRYTLQWNIFQVLHLGRLQPYLPTLHQAGKACQVQTLQLITKIHKLLSKKFYEIDTRTKMIVLKQTEMKRGRQKNLFEPSDDKKQLLTPTRG